ncbi:hypothetical protein [Georgenia sp. SUBG003]|uniref:GHMP family kinase ATP-binding protein n=1 Tax=Georgenia sp. SUBG003 TaxID=1497974 RepID=UPI003AB6266B
MRTGCGPPPGGSTSSASTPTTTAGSACPWRSRTARSWPPPSGRGRAGCVWSARRSQGRRARSTSTPSGRWARPARCTDGPPTWPGCVWALEADGLAADLPGLDLAVDSCVPAGAGLSSSAALECAVAVAVDELAGLGLAGPADAPDDAGRARLAAACVRAENGADAGRPAAR